QEACEAYALYVAAYEVESEEKCRAPQSLNTDKRIVREEGRNDAAGEESKQCDVDVRPPVFKLASCSELNAPGCHSEKVRTLGYRDRVRCEYGIHDERD